MDLRLNVGFTGSSKIWHEAQLLTFLRLMRHLAVSDRNDPLEEFHHGACIKWDEIAHLSVVETFNDQLTVVVHPPINKSKMAKGLQAPKIVWREPKEYIPRNHDIVDDVDYMVGCPGEMKEELRSGTWATIRYAKKKKKPVFVVWPDGLVEFTDRTGKSHKYPV